jgi:hypothetical protein
LPACGAHLRRCAGALELAMAKETQAGAGVSVLTCMWLGVAVLLAVYVFIV